jgi:Zn-dependent protease
MFGLSDLSLGELIGRFLVVILSIPIHEFAHCWMAYLLGDTTAERQGRLTLNIFAHLDPVGTLMILLTGYGWGRAAPVNPYQMNKINNPRAGMAISALAGPLSNILQALILALPLRLGLLNLLPTQQGIRLWEILSIMIWVNLGLAIFNMLPIPPLDGSHVLAGVAPPRLAEFIESLTPIAPYLLMFVVFILPQVLGFNVIGRMVAPIQFRLWNLLVS